MAWSSRSGEIVGHPGLDQDQRIGGPLAKSSLLHLGVLALLFAYGYLHGFLHSGNWGSNSLEQGAIQATLVSSAALPLPQTHPPTDNVLATETPSVAPELAEQKVAPMPLPEAIPIPEKQTQEKRSKVRAETPKPKPLPPPKPQYKARYGEAAPANAARSMANNARTSTANAVTGGDFGSRFGWYVDVIKRKVAQNWYLQEVSPSTPAGTTVYVQFSVARDGSPGQVTIATSSGVPSLDSSCQRAVQRVDTFGPLPAGYTENSLNVLYHCTYPGTP